MDPTQLINRIKQHLKPSGLLDESGSVVFSSVDTISKGDLYTLGLNPGGEAFIPISQTLSKLPIRKSNAYIDETWGNRRNPKYPPGNHPLQRNFVGLIKSIGFNPSQIFSSNLIFFRSHGQHGSRYLELADICWKVHQEFISIVDPKYFIVFGNSGISPFRYIRERYSLEIIDTINSGHGKWKCYYCYGIIENKERVLIGVPHLSRYYISKHENVLNWIISRLQNKR